MYLLDTDVFTLAYTRRSLIPPLEARISATRQDQLYLSVITVRESLKGALGLISRKEQTADIAGAYNLLQLVLERVINFSALSAMICVRPIPLRDLLNFFDGTKSLSK